MILHNEYLTDEELELLISEAEDDLVPAPPDMADVILNAIWNEPQTMENSEVSAIKRKTRQSIKASKKRAFAAYCFRVAMSVAAAIAFIFIMPYLPDFAGDGGRPATQEYMDKETFLKENGSQFQSRQEVYTEYPSREEVLNDKSMMQRLLDGENIFDGDLNAPEFPKEPDEPGIEPENIPTTGSGNNNTTDFKYENGGQSL